MKDGQKQTQERIIATPTGGEAASVALNGNTCISHVFVSVYEEKKSFRQTINQK